MCVIRDLHSPGFRCTIVSTSQNINREHVLMDWSHLALGRRWRWWWWWSRKTSFDLHQPRCVKITKPFNVVCFWFCCILQKESRCWMFSQAFAHHQTNKQHHVVVVAAGPSASVAPPRERRHNSQEHPTLQPKGSVGRVSNLPAVSMNTHTSLISTLTPIINVLKTFYRLD